MEWMYVFWLILAIILIIIELNTMNLTTIWFAIGSIGAMIVAIFLPEWFILQLVVFLVISIISLILTRRYISERLHASGVKTNVNALIGRIVVVTKSIEEHKYGEVKVDGNYWTAKSATGEPIEVGSEVEILEISGVKLIVKEVKK